MLEGDGGIVVRPADSAEFQEITRAAQCWRAAAGDCVRPADF